MDHLSGLNSSEEDSAESREESRLSLFRSLDIMCLVVYSLGFVVGVVGNSMVVWATAFKLKKTSSTVWFLNLALSDLLYLATLPMAIMHQALDYHWPLGRFMCKLYFTTDSVTMFASVYLLVVISVDRCVSVVWPSSAWAQKKHQRGAWRRKVSYVSVAGVWALAAAVSTPLFVSLDAPTRSYDNVTECTVVFSNYTSHYTSPSVVGLNEQALDALNITYSLLGFVVPLVVIVSCYAVIFWRRSGGSPLGRPFRVAAAVTASFFLCFGSHHVTSVFGLGPAEVWFYNIGRCLEVLYRCVNPLLYATVGRRDLLNKESVLEVLQGAFAEDEEPRSEPSANLPLSDKE